LQTVFAACSDVGTATGTLTGSPEVLAEALRAFAREGISHIQIAFEPMSLRSIEAFAPILELLDRG
jgi:hypothetical protein